MSFSSTTRFVKARFVKARWLSALVGGLLVGVCACACALAFAPSAFASTPTVDLGQAAGYAIISNTSVTNNGASTVRGDIGAPAISAPAAGIGFEPSAGATGVLDGTMEVAPADTAAHNDFLTAYTAAQALTGGTVVTDLTAQPLTPGVTTVAAADAIAASGVVTLDAEGNSAAVFVIQVGAVLSFGASAQVVLTNGAQASNVYWAVAGAFSVGATAQFEGTVMTPGAATIGAGSLVNGRMLATGAVTITDDEFYSAPPTVAITGGATEDINDATPTISGTTDVGTSGVVTVTVAGQTLTATPAADGSWSVTPTILANSTYTVEASTVDAAGNAGSATQQLTIDTTPPLITLDGAPSVLTSSASPTISGTTDVAAGSLITVDVEAQTLSAVVNGTPITESVGQQTLTAVVQPNGTWNVSPGVPLGLGVRTVTASVTDRAGNTSTATEQLDYEVATVAPTPTTPVVTTTPVTPTPTSPTAPVTTPAPTTPGSTPASPVATPKPKPTPAPPAPTRVSVSSHTLTAQRSVKIGWTLAKAGTVKIKLVEMVHGKTKAVGTVTVKDRKAGKDSYKLTKHFAGHKLGKGSYKLSLQTTSGKHHSKTVTEKVSVR